MRNSATASAMDSQFQLLLVSSDEMLRAEIVDAMSTFRFGQPQIKCVPDLQSAKEYLRQRRPQLVLAEMPVDPRNLPANIATLKATTAADIAVIQRPEGFHDGETSSEVLIQAMRAGAKDFLRRPISTTELEELVQRSQPRHAAAASEGKVIAFISNKGGVGKSTLAVNTAVGLATTGKAGQKNKVLLIDASLQMGVAASMLDLRPRSTFADIAQQRDRLDAALFQQLITEHESGLHLLAAPSDAVAGADVDDDLVGSVISLAKQRYDYVIVDTFPIFDRIVLTILDFCDRSYIVLENVVPTVAGAGGFLDVLDGVGYGAEKRHLVLNRMTRIPTALSAQDVANRLGTPISHVLPYDHRVIESANLGRPHILRQSFWPSRFRKELRNLVHAVEGLGSGPISGSGSVSVNGHEAAAVDSDASQVEASTFASTNDAVEST